MRRASYYWPTTFCAVLVALAGINHYVFFPMKEEILKKEEQQLRRIVDATATAVDNVLGVVQIALERIRAAHEGGLQPREVHHILRVTVDSIPLLRAAAIMDADGNVIHSSRAYPPPRIDLSDTEAVHYFRGGGAKDLFFSGPNRNLFDDKWQVQVAIPLRDASGKVRNIVAAVIDPQYICSDLFALNEREMDYVSLVDSQFRLVARYPWYDDQIANSLVEAPIFRKLASSGDKQASALVTSFFTGDRRVAAAQWLSGRRFALSTTRPLDFVLETWRITSTVVAVGSGAIVLFLGFAWLTSARAERRRWQQAATLELTNAALQAETKRAEHLAAAKTEFLANMSHEIRTPLNGVIGYAGLAVEEADPSVVRQYVGRVLDASRTLRVIIDEILDYSKVEAGELRLEQAPFSLNQTIDGCLSIVRPAAVAKGLNLEVSVEGKESDWVLGDGARIRQVLLNLLNNAIKFTEHGTVTLMVVCEYASGQVALRFAVRDTGIGIPQEDQGKLFKRFSQADNSISRRFGGTGLGLAISQRIVEAMGGRIGVDSVRGAGSTFWCSLTLPVAAAPGPSEALSGDGSADLAPLRILVVDDQEMNRDLAGTILRRAGHEVDLAEDGSVAVRKAREHQYDLILTDIQMPGIDGLETTRQIRALGRGYGRLPIVAMTANVLPEQIVLYLAAGLTDHIAKPFDSKQLLEGLVRWMRRPGAASGESAAQPAEPRPEVKVYDPAVLSELEDMLGSKRVRHFMGNLRNLLAADHWRYEPTFGTDALASSAHACVSLAGQLGFPELSQASRDLETACLSGTGIDYALEEFDLARLRALILLERASAPVRPHQASKRAKATGTAS